MSSRSRSSPLGTACRCSGSHSSPTATRSRAEGSVSGPSTRPATARTTSRSSSTRRHCFTADVLFRGTVGGTSAPDGDLAKLKHSILDVLLGLDDETQVFPGHKEETTIGDERRSNPFIRAWLDGEGLVSEPCRVNGEEATLLLWAPDYDGGNKALVRLHSGLETIVGGSRVERR